MALEITDSNYKEVLAEGKPVVVDFWAPWCGPCKMVAPIIEELAAEFEGQVIIGSIAQCLAEHSLILRGIDDQGIGWCHHDVGIRMLLLDLPAGISNTWSSIASLRLC